MVDPIKRKEATHINEVRRSATSTVQWFSEQRNKSERKQVIPRTYDALAVLGQHRGMIAQDKMVEDCNETANGQQYDPMGTPTSGTGSTDEVVAHANEIDKPSIKFMEENLRMKVSVAMLNTCGFEDGHWRYREIYIHSKLMLVDDTFMTIGSANLNIRSMNVDSEINLATVAPAIVKELRQKIWKSLSGGAVDGGEGRESDLSFTYRKWSTLMLENQVLKEKQSRMTGFLLPLQDSRSSNVRLG